MDPSQNIDANRYTIDVKINNGRKQAELNATPAPYEPPPPDPKLVNFNFGYGDDCGDLLARHVTQDVVGTKLSDSHFRPCLPNEGPLPSGCTPRNIWRPCWPPDVLTSGKESRRFDKVGSTWVSNASSREHNQGYCSFNRDWVLQTAKAPKFRRAGKLSDIGGSSLFPGRKIHTQKHSWRPLGKNVGDVVPRFRPHLGDIYVKPCVQINFHGKLDPKGYVEFVDNSRGFELDGGVMLLRMVKFRDCTLRTRKKIKLFLLTMNEQWRLKGVLDTCGYLEDPFDKVESNYRIVPVRYRQAIKPNTCDMRCIPQRGDIIIREPWKDLLSNHIDQKSSIMWWQPNLELDLNDILVRTCVWQCCSKFEAFVDLYYYNGKGLRWVFLGRDETVFEIKKFRLDSDTSDDEKPSHN